MTDNKIYKLILLITIVLLLALIAATLSFGWFADRLLSPSGGEVMPGFYAGGHGTEEEPFLITRPIHLYNLAWLQASGRYNKPNPETGVITQTYFELADNLDMEGYTLPPIGTTDFPFVGVFKSTEGKKYTITDLTVSNVIDNGEIIKRPQGVSDLEGAEVVGMFGVIGQYSGVPDATIYGNIVPLVSDFFLEDPTIRTQTQRSLVGLIAGYVNGKVHEVGVLGGSIVSGKNNSEGLYDATISNYGLIGDRDANVGWGGVTAPGDEGGGAIKVDINDPTTNGLVDNIASTDYYTYVPGSKKDAAFITGDAGIEADIKFNGFYYFNKVVQSNGSDLTTAGSNSGMDINGKFISFQSGSYAEGWIDTFNSTYGTTMVYNKDFDAALDRGNSTGGKYDMMDNGSSPPTFATDDLRAVTLSNGNTHYVPDNGVWFKPSAPGNCIISFVTMDMGGDVRYKSIYKFRRNSDGSINQDSIKETQFAFHKNQGPGTKSLVVFEYYIEQEDIDYNYEFVIGASDEEGAASSSVKFFFLALAGASQTGGPITETSLEIFQVNFIDKLPYEYNDGHIATSGMKVTTFYIQVLGTKTNDPPAIISFGRSSMTESATYSCSPQDFFAKGYDHTIPDGVG